MNDIILLHNLNIYTLFGTTTQNLLVEAGVTVSSNETGVFNVSLDIRQIVEWYDVTMDYKLWTNITIFASTNYSLGPNTTTPNETVLFLQVPNPPLAPSYSYESGWIIGTVLVFVVFCCVFRYEIKCLIGI